jgi:hypothetical protein
MENLEGRDHLEDLMDVRKTGLEGTYWMHLAEDRD